MTEGGHGPYHQQGLYHQQGPAYHQRGPYHQRGLYHQQVLILIRKRGGSYTPLTAEDLLKVAYVC